MTAPYNESVADSFAALRPHQMPCANSRPRRHPRSRNGITLLFVISIIVLFLLMGTAFVVVSNNFYRSARNRGNREIFLTDQQSILETAFYDLFRGTDLGNANSPLRGHSILGDMYGYGFRATIDGATVDTSEHFLRVRLNNDTVRLIDQSAFTPSPVPGSLTGLVVSFVSGPAQGLSTRVVDHLVTGDATAGFDHQLVLLPHWTGTGLDPSILNVVGNDRVIVNGRPFAGTGAGFLNPTDPRMPALSQSALAPNQVGRSQQELLGLAGTPADAYLASMQSTGPRPNSQAINEPYDTFDAQNMYLGGVLPNGDVIPSFHQSVLIGGGHARADFRADPMADSRADEGVVVDNDNDGRPDGIWMDIGLPVVTTADGKNVKPLVSYLATDMESRGNVNAHGSAVALNPAQQTLIGFLDNSLISSLPPGQGFGPADIRLDAILPTTAQQIINQRHGPDLAPGIAGTRDVWSNYQLFGLPAGAFTDFIPGTVGGHYGSLVDVHGRFTLGYPEIFDRLPAMETPPEEFPIGMPTFNVGQSLLPLESVDSPYEFSLSNDLFYGPRAYESDDRPYTFAELEGFLRPEDPDSPALAPRLRDMISDRSLRNAVTAFGYEVPTTFENLPERLYSILSAAIPGNENRVRAELRSMLPTELLRGLPMNVNRSFGDGLDNNGNGSVDEPGEADSLPHPLDLTTNITLDLDNDSVVTSDADAGRFRDAFMRQLYVLTLLVTERKTGANFNLATDWFDVDGDSAVNNDDLIVYRQRIAQWVVNVVDFRDRDSIMTAFECDLNPWDGWGMDGDLSTDEGADRFLVWGAERPELLITETFASHDTRTTDLATEVAPASEMPGRVVDGDDTDLDSLLVPQVTAFFELYNPWVVNDANQIRPSELYDNGLNGVDLQKTSVDGSPVWRIVVAKMGENDLDPDQPGSTQQFDRRIYFARPPRQVDSGPEVYFPSMTIRSRPISPGSYGVVGTAGQEADGKFNNYFGRRARGTAASPEPLSEENLANFTRRISMNTATQTLEVVSAAPDGAGVMWETSERQVPVLPIDRSDTGFFRNLGVSDPVAGYFDLPDPNNPGVTIQVARVADGLKFVIDNAGTVVDYVYDTPVDQLANMDLFAQIPGNPAGPGSGSQTLPAFRVVHLQRLANPLLQFEATANPYRTIDSAAVDLFVFNGSEPQAFTPTPNRPADPPAFFSSLERRQVDNGDATEVSEDRHRLLFRTENRGNTNLDQDVQDPDNRALFFSQRDDHLLSWNLIESLGRINTAYREAGIDDQRPFAALAWHNRSFINQYELAEVPFLSSSQLVRRYATADRNRNAFNLNEDLANGFELLSGQFPHLLNFYADGAAGSSRGPGLHRLMDHLETPSPFLGTESFVNPAEFVDNNHGLSFGLAPPFDRISSYRYPGKININTVLDPRVWEAIVSAFAAGGLGDGVSFGQWQQSRRGMGVNSDFDNPFRPAYAYNFVGPGGLMGSQRLANGGLFRSDGSSPPLFDYAPNPADKLRAFDVDRASQFRYALRERLGNLVTGRSSVFGIWITTGFFETDAEGQLTTTDGAIVEYGTDTGVARRGRAFYMVDRSIPVAFEPGHNHNVDRAVMRRSIIEHGNLSTVP